MARIRPWTDADNGGHFRDGTPAQKSFLRGPPGENHAPPEARALHGGRAGGLCVVPVCRRDFPKPVTRVDPWLKTRICPAATP
jgi:hypothetical protein